MSIIFISSEEMRVYKTHQMLSVQEAEQHLCQQHDEKIIWLQAFLFR